MKPENLGFLGPQILLTPEYSTPWVTDDLVQSGGQGAYLCAQSSLQGLHLSESHPPANEDSGK